jgi:hypothetical protein
LETKHITAEMVNKLDAEAERLGLEEVVVFVGSPLTYNSWADDTKIPPAFDPPIEGKYTCAPRVIM